MNTPLAERFLVVSIHDVSPLSWKATDSILQRLDRIGVRARSLLVIPNHHAKAPIDKAAPEFLQWLKNLSDRDEICLHGYEHRAAAIPGGLSARLVATVYTHGEGEFYRISANQADALLQSGLDRFAQLGLAPAGFVAPAWLLSAEAGDAVRRKGFQYTTRLRSIDVLHPVERRLRAPTLCYSARSAWRRAVSRIWNRTLAHVERNSPILRAAIHPLDAEYSALLRDELGLIERAAKDRTVITYRDLVARLKEGAVADPKTAI